MKKRRTKKDKQKALHHFTYSLSPKLSNKLDLASVKRQTENSVTPDSYQAKDEKNAVLMAKDGSTAKLKKDLGKSLITVSLILALEIVLYSVWH